MDVGAQLLQALLVADAEMLLLVDDQQAEVLELDALGQQRVGADHDVDVALLDRLLGRLGLLGGDQARQAADAHRQALEALAEGAVMLARQQRGRRDHRDLLARQRRHEGRAQRHLGLAEADVAADQPVHRLAGRHVVQHVGDGLELIVGLGVGEAGAELLVGAFGRAHGLAAADGAFGGDLDQPVGHVGDALLQPRLARLPGDAAQAVEGRALLRRAVAAQHVDVLDRHEELVAALVGQPEAVVPRVLDLQRDQAFVSPDAVLAMDDQVALAQGRGLGDEALGRPPLLGRPRQPIADDVLFADDFQAIQHEAVLDRPDGDAERAGRQALHRGEVGNGHRRRGAVLLQQVLQAARRAFGVARDQHAPAGGVGRLHVLGHHVEQVDALSPCAPGQSPRGGGRRDRSCSARRARHRSW